MDMCTFQSNNRPLADGWNPRTMPISHLSSYLFFRASVHVCASIHKSIFPPSVLPSSTVQSVEPSVRRSASWTFLFGRSSFQSCHPYRRGRSRRARPFIPSLFARQKEKAEATFPAQSINQSNQIKSNQSADPTIRCHP